MLGAILRTFWLTETADHRALKEWQHNSGSGGGAQWLLDGMARSDGSGSEMGMPMAVKRPIAAEVALKGVTSPPYHSTAINHSIEAKKTSSSLGLSFKPVALATEGTAAQCQQTLIHKTHKAPITFKNSRKPAKAKCDIRTVECW
ncbi:hypothetical protein Nepgr_015555 [Nepenthes gracilis]|uniref:Uncharacterized protein n=1 Tax=Nepenthes gracilis TaxID=150966 RepID=A0AAD3SN02_NEPGR|nr:hypothetical protein Nepgr_015555 [Nepenthes gracilis]